MKIYRLSNESLENSIDMEKDLIDPESRLYEEKIENLFNLTDEQKRDILGDFYDKKRKKNTMMKWTVIPKARLIKIWNDYSRNGVVHDYKGMQEIADKMIELLARLRASNDLSGHSQGGWSDIEDITGYKIPTSKDRSNDFNWSYLETPYGTPISDYGLPKLEEFASNLMRSQTPEQQLFWVDAMLNVVHQRGDLAALFIEGGKETLNQLKGKGIAAKSNNWYKEAKWIIPRLRHSN